MREAICAKPTCETPDFDKTDLVKTDLRKLVCVRLMYSEPICGELTREKTTHAKLQKIMPLPLTSEPGGAAPYSRPAR